MAYSCWAALSAAYRTLSRSLPKGRCGPCFSRMPNGSRHVPCARVMASRNSAAVSSSQCTESLLCADGCDGAGEDAGDCAHKMEAQRALMESSSVLCKGSSNMRGPRVLTLLARGDSCQVRAARAKALGGSCRLSSRRLLQQRWVRAFDHEPQHDRQLPEQSRLRKGKQLVLIVRKE